MFKEEKNINKGDEEAKGSLFINFVLR